MTGKVINSGATGLLILIIPIAFVVVLLLEAWPFLLALLLISIGWVVWQQYQWKQWSKQVNPFFNQLIRENQGCLTPVDLSLKANLSGSAARRYLDKRAEEFGAQRRFYEDRGIVYYFLTASALGSIFDDSEPSLELDHKSFSDQSPKLIEQLTQKEPIPRKNSSSTDFLEGTEVPAAKESYSSQSKYPPEEISAVQQLQQQPDSSLSHHKEKEEQSADLSNENQQQASSSLIQAELAKRLDVHSSTVGKRKSDPDFSEWSQTKDPQGIAWEYLPDTKEFVPHSQKL